MRGGGRAGWETGATALEEPRAAPLAAPPRPPCGGRGFPGHGGAGEGGVCSCAGGGTPHPGRGAAVGVAGLGSKDTRGFHQQAADSACRRVAARARVCVYTCVCIHTFGCRSAGICRKEPARGAVWAHTREQGRTPASDSIVRAPGGGNNGNFLAWLQARGLRPVLRQITPRGWAHFALSLAMLCVSE